LTAAVDEVRTGIRLEWRAGLGKCPRDATESKSCASVCLRIRSARVASSEIYRLATASLWPISLNYARPKNSLACELLR